MANYVNHKAYYAHQWLQLYNCHFVHKFPIITQASNYFVLLVIPNSIMLYTFMDPLYICMDPILERI